MKTNKLIITGLVALWLAALSAQAVVLPGSDIGGIANVGGSSPGDLILGFRNSANADILFDIGQFTAYEGVAAGTYTIGGFKTSELATVDSAAFTTAGTTWAVLGSTGAGNGLTKPDNSLWSTSTGTLLKQSSGIQSGISTNFDGLLASGLSTSTFGGASDANVLSSPKLYTNLSPGTSYTGFFPAPVESTTVGTTSMNLYELTPGSGVGTLLGTFTLSSSGLTFTAIPEPSTYAAILGAATLGVALIRRRRLQQIAA